MHLNHKDTSKTIAIINDDACSQIKQKTSGFKSPVDLSLLGLKQKGLYLHGLLLLCSTLSTNYGTVCVFAPSLNGK